MVPNTIGLLSDRLREMGAQLSSQNWGWFKKRFIDVVSLGSCYILNYTPFEPFNQWNILANGTVYSFHGDLWLFGLTRIGSFGAVDSPDIDLRHCEMLEKVDGDMVMVSFLSSKTNALPITSTKKMVSVVNPGLFNTDEDIKTVEESVKCVRHLKWTAGDIPFTFTFEMVRGDKQGFYLIGVRNREDFSELDECELDTLSHRLGAVRPGRWYNVTNWDAIKRVVVQTGADSEGFILRDKSTGLRNKIQRKKWVERKKERIAEVAQVSKERQNATDTALSDRVRTAVSGINRWRADSQRLSRRALMEELRNSTEPRWMHSVICKFVYDDDPTELPRRVREHMIAITHGELRRLTGLRS